ncbi:putative cytochrome P450 cyp-13B1 [Oppia nitens]|uniref:putative cytochrome P450 cyp-13B1 n=1 Tax=Oppia nitens TaxID=1686743 RepID=UPI0023DC284A|nr:putative cytochrome P450 cyp-13B1 [Oppia nitens]
MNRVGSFLNNNISRWKQIRTQTTLFFNSARMRVLYDQVIDQCSANLVKHFANNIGTDGQQFAVKAEISRLTVDIFMGEAFTRDSHMGNYGDRDPDKHRQYWSLVAAGFRLDDEMKWRELNVRMPEFVQSVVNWLTGHNLCKSLGEVEHLISGYLIERLEKPIGGDNTDKNENLDIVGSYLKLIDKNVSLTDPLSIEMMSYYLVVQFLGLIGGTGDTLSEFVVHLARYPAVQKKMYNELAEALENSDQQVVMDNIATTGANSSSSSGSGSRGRRKLSYDTLTQLPYLDAVVKELFRINTAFRLSRVFAGSRDSEAARIFPGIRLAPGDRIDVQLTTIHQSAELFPRPDQFNPDRFLDPANENRWSNLGSNTLLSFGQGPQMCCGTRLGLLVVKSFLSHMMYAYEFCLPPEPVDQSRPDWIKGLDVPENFYQTKCCIKRRN